MIKILLLLISIILILFLVIGLFFLYAWSARKTLLKGGDTWTAKNLKIKRNEQNISKNKKKNSSKFLESIYKQTDEFLTEKNNLN